MIRSGRNLAASGATRDSAPGRFPCAGPGWTVLIIGTSALTFVAACAKPAPLQGLPPDVALIVIDTLRHDEMPWAGSDQLYAPVLERLSQEGAAFPLAYAPSPWTRPSTTTILTGLEPDRHGVLHHVDMLDDSVETLAEIFSSAGYETGAVVANPSLFDSGTQQGFESFQSLAGWIDHSSDRVAAEARSVLAGASRSRPLFLYVHFLDPHDLYVPPEEDRIFLPEGYAPSDPEVARGNLRFFEGDTPVWQPTDPHFTPTPRAMTLVDLAYMRGLYRGEIRAADRQLGAILDSQRALRGNGLHLVVTSDHGEAFFEHGMYRHGWTLHEEVIRVPMLLHGPGIVPGHLNTDRIARSADIAPSLTAMAGIRPPSDSDGRSLLEPAAGPEGPVIGQTRYHVQQASFLIAGPWKLIIDERFGLHELYNLELDPLEMRNLAGTERSRIEQLIVRHGETRRGLVERRYRVGKIEGRQLEQLNEAMRALGYIR